MRILAISLLLALLGALGPSDPSPAQDILEVYGDPLSPARGLRSRDGRFWVNMQGDENFVVYGRDSTPCWSSDTMRDPGNNPNSDPRVFLTEDELAIWVRDPRSQRYTKRKVLAQRTTGPKFKSLVIRNDGNLVLYDESHSELHNGVKFATGVAEHKGCDY